jgi:hypothetical protein
MDGSERDVPRRGERVESNPHVRFHEAGQRDWRKPPAALCCKGTAVKESFVPVFAVIVSPAEKSENNFISRDIAPVRFRGRE